MKGEFKKNRSYFNVCLSGASLETGNMGVSALAASLVKIICHEKPNANILFLIGYKSQNIRFFKLNGQRIKTQIVNYRLSPRAKIREHLFFILLMACLQYLMPLQVIKRRIIQSVPWLNALKDADFVGDIHGGDSFSDIYGLIRFFVEIVPNFIVFLMKKKLVLLPQTYGPYNHFITKKIARYILVHSSIILSRDKQSFRTVIKILGDRSNEKKVVFCPDVAFTLDAVKLNERELEIEPIIHENHKFPLVGININGLIYNGGYTRDNMFKLKCDYKSFIKKLVTRFMTETSVHILFVPHAFGPSGNVNSDFDAIFDVYKTLPESYQIRVHLIKRKYDQHKIKGIIGRCDFFIGSRMHACIAALSQNIPAVGIAYSKKFIGVFESVGIGEMVIDARSMTTENIIEKILILFRCRDMAKKQIKSEINSVKIQVVNSFKNLLNTK